ncbi:probable RNA-dependent RNA polymerase 1 [Impatiens glandulifera]|uniref:probable RNA-dependent RNA polymerase 1 n=1 Tax=Impatiens glandulifera TaxID=253017 RepID=UPI001FB18C1B|nr:probable RNA-dependent RNA polymerase 1 [Impatiens glandulifera]XP_047307595.1 probable RNA-dependent RNA polymerase 1 [Impatiens glandulifera]
MKKTIDLTGFPYLVTAETITEFLERKYTGKGSVIALEVKKPKNVGSRVYARVQFKTVNDAEYIINLANMRQIYYGTSYLKAFPKDIDLVQNPKIFEYDMKDIKLYFGCLVSKDKFSVLWGSEDVMVRFGFQLRKLYFFLSYNSFEYKLQLSYENIWQIDLRRPRNQLLKYLVIQLVGAPRIYLKNKESSMYSFFKETPDEHWIRATDFTPSYNIGQSSALCLQFKYDLGINFVEYFPYYNEYDGSFLVEDGTSYCCHYDLVPIVAPPIETKLPFNVIFKICALVQQGCLPGPLLDSRFYRLVDPSRMNIVHIEHALETLFNIKESCYEPVKWLMEQYQKYISSKRATRLPSIKVDDGLVYVRRVQITPSKVWFSGPEVNMSNRVIRQFSSYVDNFLRVSFVDEELGRLHSMDLSPRSASIEKRTGVYKRVVETLRNGIKIGDEKFNFLAFSSSQLRENSAWMFSSTKDGAITADSIRKWMGDFHKIRNVAKYAARLGQSFSSSTETLTILNEEIDFIHDIETVTRGISYTFSDGIGKISSDFARKVAKKCNISGSVPSAFQIRYGGYKGVIAVDPDSSSKISLRPSMMKYESKNTKLDVLAWSKYQPCFLNRQVITLLSTLEVKDEIFEEKQKEAVDKLDAILKDPYEAQDALELMSPGENTNILKELLMCGYKPDKEPFLSMMLQTFRAAKLLELRTKSRIFIPKGRGMMGCLDETKTLEYGQVFVQYSDAGHRYSRNETIVITGKVVVAKNPCLHPGDVRVLLAVDVPRLHHMVDCVVFPQKGERPHPNECSGSDLDGDIYFVCWDKDLIPPRQCQPMDYTAAPNVMLDHDVTMEEVEVYFADYIVNDSLGIIANAHTVFADRGPEKAMSSQCKELAELFSIAVDFPKTGVPANIPPHLRVKEYPDFMEKPDKTTYISQRVIGKLFRAVKDVKSDTILTFTREIAKRSYDPEMEVENFMDYLEDALDYKREYDYKLGNLMDYYGIKTEGEILSGCIMKMSRSFDRRKDAESVGLGVKALRKEARSWFNKKTDEGGDNDDVYAKASAWYHVTYHPDYWGYSDKELKRGHFISFPWCVYDKLMSIKRDKARSFGMSSLGRDVSSKLRLS